ncbi:hypothetical protein D3C71_1707210 [compost metagenome]
MLRSVQQGRAQIFAYASGQKIKMVQPFFPKSAKADENVVLLRNPDLIFLEDDIAEIVLVFLETVQVW